MWRWEIRRRGCLPGAGAALVVMGGELVAAFKTGNSRLPSPYNSRVKGRGFSNLPACLPARALGFSCPQVQAWREVHNAPTWSVVIRLLLHSLSAVSGQHAHHHLAVEGVVAA